MTASLILRERTAEAHVRVDAAFGSHDLADGPTYRAFLLAHARALSPAEDAISRCADLPAIAPRMPALAADLAALGMALPAPLPLPPLAVPALWGLLYVVEGSRLGGVMLARSVGEGMPRAYLSAAHTPGGWRALRAAIDAEGARQNEAWIDAAVAGALAGFALYERAAAAR